MKRLEEIHEDIIPSIHPNIDLNHIHENGKIISDTEYNRIKDKMQKERLASCRFNDNGAIGDMLLIGGKHYASYFNNPLGKDAFGDVYIAQEMNSKDLVAVKYQVFSGKDADEKSALAISEQKIMQDLGTSAGAIATKNKHFMIMNLSTGVEMSSLSYPKQTPKQMSTGRRLQIGFNAFDAISSLHTAGIIHADIKGKNFITQPITGQTSPIDFGLSVKVSDPNVGTVLKEIRGTPGYIAPEIVKERHFSTASDVYALGKMFGNLCGLTENIRYAKGDPRARSDAIRIIDRASDEFLNNKCIPDSYVRGEILTLIKSMTQENPNKRPGMKQAKAFLQNIMDFQVTLAGKINNVGLLNIQEYKEAAEEKYPEARKEKLETLINALKVFDEVWFINPGKATSAQEIKAYRRDLEQHGVWVADRMFRNHSAANIAQQIPGYENKTSPHAINLHFFVTANERDAKEAQAEKRICSIVVNRDTRVNDYCNIINEQYKKVVDPKHIEFALKDLEKNILYLVHKYGANHTGAKKRCDEIQNYIEQLTLRKDNVTYVELFKDLDVLQSKMTATGKFSKIFNIKSTAATKVENVKTEIERKIVSDEPETRAAKKW